jgi:site-specific recombinase XerD
MSIAWEKAQAQRQAQAETQEFSVDPSINHKIKIATAGLQKNIMNLFWQFPTDKDKELVADFIIACIKQENIAINTKCTYLIALAYLSRYLKNKKSFDDMTSDDLTSYIDSLQPDNPPPDVHQSWINTQKTMALSFSKFFKWKTYPKLTPQQRKRLPKDKQPSILEGLIFPTKKGSKSPVTASDIWHDKDVAVFVKYCSHNPRLRLYHSLAHQASGRVSELLQLKIGDIADNIQTDENGKLCALVDIGRYGKKKESRIIGITDFTIQYYQAYLPYHPDPTNKKAFLFVSREHSAQSRNLPITSGAMRSDYINYRDKHIPKLLKRPDVSEEDKKHLEFIRDNRKWYPRIMRHSSLTKLAGDPNVNDYVLREHAGWSKRSDMVEIYTHDLKGSSVEHVMLAYGINLKGSKKKQNEKLQQEMVGQYCPFCHMVNVPDAQICSSCRRPISPLSITKVMEENEQTKKELAEIREIFVRIEENEVKLKQKNEELAALQNHIMKRLAWQEEKDKEKMKPSQESQE